MKILIFSIAFIICIVLLVTICMFFLCLDDDIPFKNKKIPFKTNKYGYPIIDEKLLIPIYKRYYFWVQTYDNVKLQVYIREKVGKDIVSRKNQEFYRCQYFIKDTDEILNPNRIQYVLKKDLPNIVSNRECFCHDVNKVRKPEPFRWF